MARIRERGLEGGSKRKEGLDGGYVPVVLRSGPYRFYFFSHENDEPPHVHVDRDEASAKFWIDPVRLAYNLGFRAPELRRVERIVAMHAIELLEAWREFHRT